MMMIMPTNQTFHNVYRSRSVKNTNNKPVNYSSWSGFYVHPYDTLSFSARKKDINQEIVNLPDDAFPSTDFAEYIKNEVKKSDEQIDLLDLHKKYYSGLYDCKTLEEAKKMYPETEKTVDVKDIDLSKLRPESIFLKINNGIKEGVDLSNLSLEMLKMYYAELKSAKEISECFHLGGTGYAALMKKLNIKADERYMKLVTSCKHIRRCKRMWDTDSYRNSVISKNSAHAKNQWQNPEYRELKSRQGKAQWDEESKLRQAEIMSERMLMLNVDPEYRKRNSQRTSEYWSDEKHRQEQSERIAEYRRNHPEFEKKLSIVYEARKEACKRHPEITEMRRKIAQESYPSLFTVFDKKNRGMALSSDENIMLSSYYKKCFEAMPDHAKIIGETQKEVLKEWGFYDEDIKK